MEDIIRKLKTILSKYTYEKHLIESVSGDTKILKDLKINSARIIDIILDVEEEFEIEVDDISMEKILTVGDLAEVIRTKSS